MKFIKKLSCIFIIVLIFLLNFALVWAGGGGAVEEHHGVTPTQIKNLIWWAINFFLLLVILYKYAREPFLNLFKTRQENLVNQYNQLLQKKKEAEAKYIELQEKIKNLEKEAQEIYQNYVEQGIKEKERIIAEANAQAERIKQQAELYIAQEVEKVKAQLREELAEISLRLAEELLKKNITPEDQKKILKSFINEIKGRVLH